MPTPPVPLTPMPPATIIWLPFRLQSLSFPKNDNLNVAAKALSNELAKLIPMLCTLVVSVLPTVCTPGIQIYKAPDNLVHPGLLSPTQTAYNPVPGYLCLTLLHHPGPCKFQSTCIAISQAFTSNFQPPIYTLGPTTCCSSHSNPAS